MKVKGVEVTERGWAGHYICSNYCRFRRNTLLEYEDKKWIVSTVGACMFPGDKKPREIGLGRYYETMVFEAELQGEYLDANVSKEMWPESSWAIEEITDDVDNRANDMHETIVKEFIEKIKK